VRALKSAGTAVLLVEQSVDVAVSVADRVYVMESGAIRFSGTAAEVRDRPNLLRSIFLRGGYPGAEPARPSRPAADVPATGSARALEVTSVSVAFGGIGALDDVSLVAGRGEVVGIIGPNGAGKTTLFDVISGFTRPDHGGVVLEGTDLTVLSAGARARLGLGRSFQDSSLFGGLSVRDTLAVALERFVDAGDPLNAVLRLPIMVDTEAAVRVRVDELIELFGLSPFADSFVSELSTGTRRLVDLAAVVAHAPTVVLLDEPSSGVAQREVEAMGELLRRVRRTLDATLLVVEHDISFVSSLADRLVALDRGSVLAAGETGEVLARPEVVEAFLGTEPLSRSRSGAIARGPEGSLPSAAGPEEEER
jgi:ABC-type branched-subunit amino acid transport system ATPase component